MAAIALAVILATAMTMFVAANPRCLVRRVQTQPMIWTCDGAKAGTSTPSANEAKVLMKDKSSAVHFVDIPEGTSDFVITLLHQEAGAAELLLQDASTGESIVKDKMQQIYTSPGGHKLGYNGTYQGLVVKYSELSYYQQESLRIEIPGPTTTVLSLLLKNNHGSDVFTLHYRYAAYHSGPQCDEGAAAQGCSEYYGEYARDTAASWSNWMKQTYPDGEAAWQALAEFDGGAKNKTVVPYWRWPTMWMKYPQAKEADTWLVYKFLTHGGLEVGAKYLERGYFDLAYDKIIPIAQFAYSCCQLLKSIYRSARAAVDASASAAEDNGFNGRSGYGIIEICGGMSKLEKDGIAPDDYLKWYLDPDGIGGFGPENLDYCWHPQAAPPPAAAPVVRPRPAPTPAPTPAPQPMPADENPVRISGPIPPEGEPLPNSAGSSSPGGGGGAERGGAAREDVVEYSIGPGSGVETRPLIWSKPSDETSEMQQPELPSTVTAKNCSWIPHEDCVQSFSFGGKSYTGCSTQNWQKGWCSVTPEMVGEWRECNWVCKADAACYWKPEYDCVERFAYKGTTYSWCTTADHPTGWCSQETEFQARKWRHCTWVGGCEQSATDTDEPDYPDDTEGDGISGPDVLGVTPTATSCRWHNKNCVQSFEYRGKTHVGCTDVDHNGFWCSLDKTYAERWAPCGWECQSDHACYWKPREMCVPSFNYLGQQFSWCTKANNVYNGAWCSETSTYDHKWHHCDWECPSACHWVPASNCVFPFKYKGVDYNSCTKVDHHQGWCSTTPIYQGAYAKCSWPCPEPTPKPVEVNHEQATLAQNNSENEGKELITLSATNCSWETPSKCTFPFSYKGVTYNKCTDVDHDHWWCSVGPIYTGKWEHCTLRCDAPKGCAPHCSSYWEPVAECAKEFKYKGQLYTGCITNDRGKGWCSTTYDYNGKYAVCNLHGQEDPGTQAKHKDMLPVIIGSSAAAAVGLGGIAYGLTVGIMSWTGGGPEACPTPDLLVVNQPNKFRTYSSVSGGLFDEQDSTLFSTSAWMAAGTTGQWMTIDLTKIKSVAGVVMRARADKPMWVSEFEALTSTNARSFTSIGTFAGPTSADMEARAVFNTPVLARYLRLEPTMWTGSDYPAMRAALLTCEEIDGSITPISSFSGRINDVSFNWDGSETGTPEMYNGTDWNPICRSYFSDNNNGATIICKQMGFDHGEVIKIEGGTYAGDTVFVQTCLDSSATTLESCNGGGLSPTGTMGLPQCARGQEVGMQVKCSGGIEGIPPVQARSDVGGGSSGSFEASSGEGSSSNISGESSWGGVVWIWLVAICLLCLALFSWIPFVFFKPHKSRTAVYDEELMEQQRGGWQDPGWYQQQQSGHQSGQLQYPQYYPSDSDNDQTALIQSSATYGYAWGDAGYGWGAPGDAYK